MITVPACPKLTNALAGESDLDAAVGQLFALIRFNFDRALVLRLVEDSGIDVSRAETELRLLDLFAVYFAIETTDCEKWKHVGSVLFERVCTKVLASWAPAWDTQDDVMEVLKGRFAAYSRLVERHGDEDLDTVSLLMGFLCAMTIRGGRRLFGDDRAAFDDGIVQFAEQDSLVCTTAATVFRSRLDAVSALLLTLKSPALT